MVAFRKLEIHSLSLQILAMLSAHFLILSAFLMFSHLFYSESVSLLAILYPFHFTWYAFIISLSYIPTCLLTSILYSKLVTRYKLAWDFGLTISFIQLIMSILYSQSMSFWYLLVLSVYGMLFTVTSQYICQHYETEPIAIEMDNQSTLKEK
eukprot:NODE_369_length_8668_cov_1.088575.p6 type:complete len:152 gc:universal NODE_369_length_8668_cov_1.088575:5471-5926(+)